MLQPRSQAHNFDVPYIIYSKFSKSRARNLQTFQSGFDMVFWSIFETLQLASNSLHLKTLHKSLNRSFLPEKKWFRVLKIHFQHNFTYYVEIISIFAQWTNEDMLQGCTYYLMIRVNT